MLSVTSRCMLLEGAPDFVGRTTYVDAPGGACSGTRTRHRRWYGCAAGEQVGDEAPVGGIAIHAALLADLARISPDLLCAVSPGGEFLAVNPAWERVLGWQADELVGRPFADFLEGEHRERTLAVWTDRVLRGEIVVDFQNQFPCRDGTFRWLNWSAAIDRDSGVVYCSGRDVSDRVERFVELAHETHLLSEAEQVAGIGVWDWQVDEDLGYLSAGLCDIYGTPVGEPLSLGQLLTRIAPEDRDWYEERLREAVERGTTFEAEYRVVRPDGRDAIVWERGNAVVVGGRTTRMFGTVKDVTERRRTELQLRQAAELEHARAEQLRRIDLIKTAFLSAISHELRTPLAVIQGAAETLQRGGEHLAPARRKEIEEALVRHIRRFASLLSDLLDLDRRTRGSLQVERAPIDVAELVGEVVERSPVRPRVELEAPPSLPAYADQVQTERVVTNLLENAGKYAPEGTVEIVVSPLGGGGFRLEVADEGPGVDPDDLERIFDPFYRSEPDEGQPGSGIGLALVDAFVTLQGGRVWAEARDPHGLRFVIEVPGTRRGQAIAAAATPATTAAAVAPTHGDPASVASTHQP
jgi:PAS domain S-box-containing protein